MFAGTGGLADYNLPEDVNFRGLDLLRTPSPAAWSKPWTPGSGATGGHYDQVCLETPEEKVRRPAGQLSSGPAPAKDLGTAPPLAAAIVTFGAVPATADAPPGLAGLISPPDAAGAAGVPAKGRGRRSGLAYNSSQAAVEGTAAEAEEVLPKKRARKGKPAPGHQAVADEPGAGLAAAGADDGGQAPPEGTAEEVEEVLPKKKARRRGPATSHPAVADEPGAELAAVAADAGEAEEQPKARARARSTATASSSPAETEQAEAEAAEEQPKKRARQGGPSTSGPSLEAEAEAVAVEVETLGAMGYEDFAQHVDWDAIRKLKTFAGRYLPNTKAGSGTWVTRRTLFFSLVPQEYQTTKLQLSFWKYQSEKTGAGMSEVEAARQFALEGQAGAAAAAD